MGCIVQGGGVLSQALSLSGLGQRADRQAGITTEAKRNFEFLTSPSCSKIRANGTLVSNLQQVVRNYSGWMNTPTA